MLCDDARLYIFGKHLRLRPDISQGRHTLVVMYLRYIDSSVVQAYLRNICCVLLKINIRRVNLRVCNITRVWGPAG